VSWPTPCRRPSHLRGTLDLSPRGGGEDGPPPSDGRGGDVVVPGVVTATGGHPIRVVRTAIELTVLVAAGCSADRRVPRTVVRSGRETFCTPRRSVRSLTSPSRYCGRPPPRLRLNGDPRRESSAEVTLRITGAVSDHSAKGAATPVSTRCGVVSLFFALPAVATRRAVGIKMDQH